MDPLPQTTPPLDEAVLTRLVALAGPTDGPELMRRLIGDLSTIAVGLQASLAAQDQKTLRQHCHNLLAIAGTLSAQPIYQLAKSMNHPPTTDSVSEPKSWPDTSRHVAELDWRLSGLISHLRLLSGQMGIA